MNVTCNSKKIECYCCKPPEWKERLNEYNKRVRHQKRKCSSFMIYDLMVINHIITYDYDYFYYDNYNNDYDDYDDDNNNNC